MNEELIKRWNERIGKNDEVYHLGDFALSTSEEFIPIIERLNGVKYLIVGNHEGTALNNKKYLMISLYIIKLNMLSTCRFKKSSFN